MGSHSSYSYCHFAIWKLRLREVKWLSPGHAALSRITGIPHTRLIDPRAPDLNLDILLALSVGKGVLILTKAFTCGSEWDGA